jgi:uncharacterized protein YggE
MRRSYSPALAIAAFLAAAPPLAAQDRPSEPPPEVETVGVGERRVAPDRAMVMIQITSKATSAGAAAAQNGRDTEAVRDTLRRLGLETAVTNASYSVGPDYEPATNRESGPRRVGYAAHSTLRVQLSRLALVGQVIDAALARGATGIEGVFFESSLMQQARREALAEAATAARADAESLARAMGGSLGALLSTSTAAGNDARRANVAGRLAGGYVGMGGATQVAPNEIVITAGVVGRWRFVPAR